MSETAPVLRREAAVPGSLARLPSSRQGRGRLRWRVNKEDYLRNLRGGGWQEATCQTIKRTHEQWQVGTQGQTRGHSHLVCGKSAGESAGTGAF